MARKMTHDEFIAKAMDTHGEKYDYSKSVYESSQKKLIITCRIHGDFDQSPNKHLFGRGCKRCAYDAISSRKITPLDEFVRACKDKYGDRFEYDLSSYSGICSHIEVKCPDHGWRITTAVSHLESETGCRKCGQLLTGRKNSYEKDCFIERAIKTHGTRYDYSKSDFVDSKTRITITCQEHGDFVQIPGNHLFGSGCPSCAKPGFSPAMPAMLYLLRSDCGSMMKIGITRNIAQRESQLRRATPFSFDLEAAIHGEGQIILDMETAFHRKSMSCGLSGFDGSNEWFRYDPVIAEEIKKGA